MSEKEKWVIRTNEGDIDVSHLSPDERAKAAAQIDTIIDMINIYNERRLALIMQHLSTPLVRRRR